MFAQGHLMFLAMAIARLAVARAPTKPGGILEACHEEQCDDCPGSASVNEEYPECIIYPSSGNLAGFEAESGNGYDVWWNSGDPDPGCKIIVRTPASTDAPDCGYFLTSWDIGGCYYTSIQDTFMLQYCCGDENCNDASPSKRSIEEVHAAYLTGVASSTSLVFNGFNDTTAEGSIDLGAAGEVKFRRSPSSLTQKAQAARAVDGEITTKEKRCDDTFDYAGTTYTKGGEQVKVSPTQVCNIEGGCEIQISSSVTTMYSVSFSFGIDIEVIQASTMVTFSESETHMITNTFSQTEGTTGYVTFIPTLTCYSGTYHSCDSGTEDGDACNPKMIGEGDSATPDGTYSFVYTN